MKAKLKQKLLLTFKNGGHVLFKSLVSIYVYWCPTRFPYQMMFLSFYSNTTGDTSGAGAAYLSGAHEFTLCF